MNVQTTPKGVYVKLLEAQRSIGAISRDSTNPFFKSKYFDINKIIEEVKPVLDKVGLVVMQPLTHLEDGSLAIETTIIDPESGSRIHSVCPLPVKEDPQKMGSMITYYRRYCLQSMLFLQAEDDDANAAANKVKPKEHAAQALKQDKPKAVNKVQVDKINNLVKALAKDEAKMLEWAEADKIENISKEKGDILIASLQSEMDKKFEENTTVTKK